MQLDSVSYFVKGLFRGIAETQQIAEQREELETHIRERIADLTATGLDFNQAFTRVIESLGNLDELFETIIGRKKSIYINKENWYMMICTIIYGTIYMATVGIWFSSHSFGSKAWYIVIPGLLGFYIPSFITYIRYRKHPLETAMVPLNYNDSIRSSLFGWLAISLASWITNILLLNSDTFLSVIWAWMPTAGVFTWPLLTIWSSWLRVNLKSLEADSNIM